MIPIELQDGIKSELEYVFQEFLTSNRKPVKIYTQHLPIPKDDDDDDYDRFPFIIIKLESGEIKDRESTNLANITFIIGVYDGTENMQGYRDCINIANKIYSHLFKKQYINKLYSPYNPVKWEIAGYENVGYEDTETTHPFYFTGLNTVWETPKLTQTETEGDVYC